ncbi:MAG TPA: PDZ domain-containing protein [Streptosporangiaceae bacterium]|nr:PDZ domain-containing protein [Streptosporangiaceae bacterium]
MSRRPLTLLVAGLAVVAAAVVAAFVPVPYVILSPGPTLNTLGTSGGKPVIQIQGHPVHPSTGNLDMVTVNFQGGPGNEINIFTALRAWLSPRNAIVPQSEVFGSGKSQQQVLRQDIQQMASSQQAATAAALCQLDIRFQTVDTIFATESGMPAAGVLRKGDVITAVDGQPVGCRATASDLLSRVRPGTPVELTIRRDGRLQQIRVRTTQFQGRAVVGVQVVESFEFPFSVRISVGNIGGPSAGLMFALAIIDKLSGSDLAGGKVVAGTGEITTNGTVGPIGGIQQKMAGARASGATVFLVPADDCSDARSAIPAGLRLIKVSTLAGAMQDLRALNSGQPVPSC